MNDLIKRTAISAFRLHGVIIAAGTVVELTKAELVKFSDANCVYPDEARNAEVPVKGSATTSTLTLAVDTAEMRKAIEEAKAEIDARMAELGTRQKLVDEATASLAAREDDLASREQALAEREKTIALKEADLATAEPATKEKRDKSA